MLHQSGNICRAQFIRAETDAHDSHGAAEENNNQRKTCMCEAAASEKKKIMPSNKVQLLQDPFLNMLRKEHIPVSIYLVNGIKLQGQIESFDQYVVILRNTLTQMVYKHAISTVVPSRAVSMTAQPAGDATEN